MCMRVCVYIYIYTYTFVCIYIYIYILCIDRDREICNPKVAQCQQVATHPESFNPETTSISLINITLQSHTTHPHHLSLHKDTHRDAEGRHGNREYAAIHVKGLYKFMCMGLKV